MYRKKHITNTLIQACGGQQFSWFLILSLGNDKFRLINNFSLSLIRRQINLVVHSLPRTSRCYASPQVFFSIL